MRILLKTLEKSIKTSAMKITLFNFEGPKGSSTWGGVAQLGEHLPCKQGVSGSIPLISTREAKGKRARD